MKNIKITYTDALLLLLIMTVMLVSCKDLQHSPRKQRKMLARYGIRDPRIENEKSILTTAQKYGLTPAYIVTVDQDDFTTVLKDFSNTIPEALIFDKKGNQIYYKDSARACNAGLFTFLPAMDRNRKYRGGKEVILNNEISKLRDIRGKALSKAYLDTTADFYIMISWAAYNGMLNKDHVKVWQDAANKNLKAKIQIIEVNLDKQDWWTKQNVSTVP